MNDPKTFRSRDQSKQNNPTATGEETMIPDKISENVAPKSRTLVALKPRARKLTSALAALVLLSCLAATASAQGDPHSRPLGDSRVFTPLPAQPGFPESIAVSGDRVYVSGGAQFGYFVPPAA